MNSIELKQLIDELKSTKCHCGGPKSKKKSFCQNCYSNLPRQYQVALYQKIGEGYEAAYKKAVEYLDERVL
jgi:hypothetical protein